MMQRTLRAEEQRPLADALQTTTQARVRARRQAILLASRGRRPRPGAEELGGSGRTRPRWPSAEHGQRCVGRKLRWVPGRPRRIPAALPAPRLTWSTQGPAGGGVDRAHWRSADLAASLDQTRGMAVRTGTRRALCPLHGGPPSRPPSRDRNADPVQQETVHQDLQA
jgi:hypothetical protein